MALLPKSVPPALSALLQVIQRRTPARLLVGRAGHAYRRRLRLALHHAAAIDAIHAELDLVRDFGQPLSSAVLFTVDPCSSKTECLLRPDLGRHLSGTRCGSLPLSCQ
jgi:ethanolamine ammonia-lyase small subunit